MSLFDINEAFLQQRFPELNLDYELIADSLNLDLAHLQLLSDCYQNWQILNLPESFWLYMLLLVDEINRGSSCLDMSSKRFQQQQKRFALTDFSHLELPLAQLTLAGEPVVVYHQHFLFFEKYHRAEQTLYRQIESLINNYQGIQYDKAAISNVLQPVFTSFNYPLNQQQIQAVITALLKPFSLVSGGPGTGKTTLVASLLKCLNALDVDVQDMALAAPTGRAAYRLTESLQYGLNTAENQSQVLAKLEAQTIHRLIGKSNRFNRGNRYHKENTLPFKVIIIDEVSMVDLQLMTDLLASVDNKCRLILVGDQFQLPSVESGAVLADLMPPTSKSVPLSSAFSRLLSELMSPYVESSKQVLTATDTNPKQLLIDSCTILNQSHRSLDGIQNISECVRVGNSDGFFQHPELTNFLSLDDTALQQTEGVMWLTQSANRTENLAAIWRWFSDRIKLQDYKDKLDRCLDFDVGNLQAHQADMTALFKCITNQQILTLVNQGSSGQQLINRYICQQIRQQWRAGGGVSETETDASHFHGQVVMMRRNEYDKQLFNGDVGVLLQSGDDFWAVFSGAAGYRCFALALLPELTTAFAITVHKSQGSEYNHVLIPMPQTTQSRLLSREILYTGMTRAKKSVIIQASQAVLTETINNQNERHSGLQFW